MGFVEWLKGVFGRDASLPPMSLSQDTSRSGAQPSVRLVEPDEDGNPFGVSLLDLTANQGWLSVSGNSEAARCALSWRPGEHDRISTQSLKSTLPCRLRYPVRGYLSEGLVYIPTAMEDKWVIAYRDGALAIARSWSGATMAVARGRLSGSELILNELTVPDECLLGQFGDPVVEFDWLVRTHALGLCVPLPVSAAGARALSRAPLVGFSFFGRKLLYAATDYVLDPVEGMMMSDGDLVAAVLEDDIRRLEAVLAAGESIDAPSRFADGAPALHLAFFKSPEVVDILLRAGASANSTTIHGSSALMAAVGANASDGLLRRLLMAGADVDARDELGFTAMHVACQFGRVRAMPVLYEAGAGLEPVTDEGLAPIHVAAANGQLEAVKWLVAHGVSRRMPSPLGAPFTLATQQGHAGVAAFLQEVPTPAGRPS